MSSFPKWYYYRDGRRGIVESQEELDALEPGWADSPVGPWDDGFDGEPPWESGKGPYAPYNDWQQYAPVLMTWAIDSRTVFSPGGPPRSLPGLVYATGPLIYDGWARSQGELFTLGGHLDDDDLLTTGKVKYAPPSGQFAWHAHTYRGFLDKATLDAYERRYEVGDVTKWVSSRPPDSIRSPTERKTRGSQADYMSWTNPQALRILKRAVQRVKDAGLPLTQTNLGHYMSPRKHRNTVRAILRHHGINIHNL
jgi:hypothetical protein